MENTQQQKQENPQTEQSQQPSQENQTSQVSVEDQLKSQPQNEAQPKKESEVKKRAFRIGVIVNGYNYEDIKYYNEQFKQINKLYKDKISLIFFGYRPEDDSDNALDDVKFEYVKPVSVIHYFKQLKALNIDLLVVPLIQNTYNATSELYNKYLELGLLSTPLLVPNIYPYNSVILDKRNGFIFENREDFIPYLKELLGGKNIGLIRVCGKNANEDVLKNFNFSKENIKVIYDLFE